MLAIAAILVLTLCQPAPAPAEPPNNPFADDAKEKAARDPNRIVFDLGGPPLADEQKRDAANKAALARVEAARQEANAPPGPWPEDEKKMKCRPTDYGLVCGNTEQGMDEQEAAQKERLKAPE